MLNSKMYSQFDYWLNLDIAKSIGSLEKRVLKHTHYLLQPEDTTENTDHLDHLDHKVTSPKVNHQKGVIKLLFWVAVSIGVTLTLAQLQ